MISLGRTRFEGAQFLLSYLKLLLLLSTPCYLATRLFQKEHHSFCVPRLSQKYVITSSPMCYLTVELRSQYKHFLSFTKDY